MFYRREDACKTMNEQPQILSKCAFIFALVLLPIGFLLAATPTPSPITIPNVPPSENAIPTASLAAGSSKDVCLACHGPFDKLVSVTSNYVFPSGEKTSPHRYLPHNSQDIPECSICHKPHPLPLTSTEGLPKANGEWCYECHHKRVLKCGTCH